MTSHPRPRRLLAGVALAALLVSGAAACSSDGSDGAAKTTTTKAAESTSSTKPKDDGTTTVDPDGTTTTEPEVGGTTTTVAGDGDRSRQAYVDAFVESFDATGEILSKEKSSCVADKFIDVIGFDTLTRSGMTPKEFAGADEGFAKELDIDDSKANQLYDQFAACDVNLADTFVKAFSAGGQALDAKTEACLRGVVTDDALRASFIASFLGKGDADPLSAASDCLGTGVGEGGGTPTTGN